MDIFDRIMGILFIIMIICVIIGIYDSFYIKPIAKDSANSYCKILGFDQYKEMSRIGLLSKNPVAIKCEYAERYTDLGVRANTP